MKDYFFFIRDDEIITVLLDFFLQSKWIFQLKSFIYFSQVFGAIYFFFFQKKKISLKFNQNTPRLRLIRDNIKKENFLDGDYSKEYNPNCDLAQVRIFFKKISRNLCLNVNAVQKKSRKRFN